MNILAMMKVFVMVLLAYILSMAISASADEVHELKSLVVPSFKVGCLTRSWLNSIISISNQIASSAAAAIL